MKYSQLKLKVDDSTVMIDDKESPVNGVKVKQYLSISDKTDIGITAVGFAYDQGMGVSFKTYLDAAFMVALIEKVSDIEFTKKQKSEILDLYDELESNGVCDDIIAYMNETDFNETVDFTKDLLSQMISKGNSVMSGAFNSIQQQNITEKLIDDIISKNEIKDMD